MLPAPVGTGMKALKRVLDGIEEERFAPVAWFPSTLQY